MFKVVEGKVADASRIHEATEYYGRRNFAEERGFPDPARFVLLFQPKNPPMVVLQEAECEWLEEHYPEAYEPTKYKITDLSLFLDLVAKAGGIQKLMVKSGVSYSGIWKATTGSYKLSRQTKEKLEKALFDG